MKRTIAASLLVLYLFTATELKQLLKVPVLLEHYQEHKEDDQNLNFISFLYMHYAGDDLNDRDQDRDMQLPFKSCEETSAASIAVLPPSGETLTFVPVEHKNMLTRLSKNFHPSYFASIWQPPKINFI